MISEIFSEEEMVVVVKGKAEEIKRLADELIGTKGVKHGKLTTTTTGKNLL